MSRPPTPPHHPRGPPPRLLKSFNPYSYCPHFARAYRRSAMAFRGSPDLVHRTSRPFLSMMYRSGHTEEILTPLHCYNRAMTSEYSSLDRPKQILYPRGCPHPPTWRIGSCDVLYNCCMSRPATKLAIKTRRYPSIIAAIISPFYPFSQDACDLFSAHSSCSPLRLDCSPDRC